jgi:FkbM family methyltransferase
MDNANNNPALVPEVVRSGALTSDPFVLIDVGCGLGIDSLWRRFEPNIHAYGLDPQLSEIERLQREERNVHVHYRAALVGLPNDDEFHKRRAEDARRWSAYFHPLARSSGFLATERATEAGRRSLVELNTWTREELTTEKVTLSDFIREEGLRNVDFVKTDTDGSDLEVLLSAMDVVKETGILGFMVETSYNAQPSDTESSIANVDRLLRDQGFLLYTLDIHRYSRAALPAPFVHPAPMQTKFGQVMWGDTVYLRDAGSSEYAELWGDELTPTKLLKLACLYELFQVRDCAAELLLRHEQMLGSLFDVRRGLDLLTPRLRGRRVSYSEYIAAFDKEPSALYPHLVRRVYRGIRRRLRL